MDSSVNHLQLIEAKTAVLGGSVQLKIWKPTALYKAPIILFHDSLGCIELWRQFPLSLAQATGHPVVAYDRLGYGRSDSRSDLLSTPDVRHSFIHQEAQESFLCVLQNIQQKLNSSDQKVILYGHSVGGAMALVAASNLGPQCKAVITEAAQMFVEDKTLEGIRAAKKLNENDATVEKLKKYHGDKARWVFDAWAETWLSGDFRSWSMEDVLPKVKCPVLAFHGDRDEYGSLHHPEMICELSGGSCERVIVKDCGHIPHREHSEVLLKKIQSFL